MMGAPEVILLNGEPTRGVSPLDRGLHFGDGVFETIACRRGRARFLALHLDRLAQGCERLQLALPDIDAVRAEVSKLAQRTDASIVKLIVTRGPALARGYAPSGKEQVTRIALRYPWALEETGSWQAGVRAGIARMCLGENPVLAGLKHLNRLEQVLAQAERDARQLRELLLFSHSGKLICGTMSNVFLVRDETLQTPRLDLCGVAGVMRRVVLREARRIGIAVEEREISAADFKGAKEAFLTNARIGIWPVNAVESQEMEIGSVTRRLQHAIGPLLEEPVDA